MAEQDAPEWRAHAAVGALLLLDTLALGYAHTGPWDSASFSLGVIGLTGLGLLYVAWYRCTFKRRGLIPWLDLWQNPTRSSSKAIVAGVTTVAAGWVMGNSLQAHVPDPSGLILILIGLLMLINGAYVKLSIGPLAGSE